MSQLRITCFNTFQVTRDAVPITRFHSVKTRALLIYLAIEQGASHPRDGLAGLLWPDHSERRARRNLSQNLMELRRAIGDDAANTAAQSDAAYLHSDTHTIAFNPASNHWVDVLAFEKHLATVDEHRGEQSAQTHGPAQVTACPTCADALRQAAALYTGPFLAGFSIDDSDLFENWLLTRREYYHQRAVETFGRLAAHYERAGDLNTARQVVRQLLALTPWQEEAHRQLMRLLARAGQRTQALAQYDRLCSALEDELGVPPSAESNALYDQILAGEIEALASPAGSAAQPSAITVTTPATPPFQALSPPPHFVERTAEMHQLQSALLEERRPILALVGMGGAGKTTLAAHLAHQMRSHFADGVLWANAVTSTPLDTLSAWGRAYGYDFGGLVDLESRAAAVRSLLADKRALIVVDNVTNAAQVRLLLPGNDGCAVLLTTRDLDVAHAVNAHAAPLGDLAPESALQLLARVLGEARVAAEEEAARAICTRLHHLPLAVEIVAQRLKSRARLSLAAMAARLRDEQQRLGLAISDQAVRTSFRVSWQALDTELQRVFALLAVFEGRSFAVAAVAHLTDLDTFDAEDALYALVALSLLREEEGGYFRQHPLLADFAQEQLVQTDEAYARMAAYYGEFAERNHENYGALEPEWGNLLGAIEVTHQQENWAQVVAFSDALAQTWLTLGRYGAARRVYAWAQAAAEKLNQPALLAANQLRWGEVCLEQSEYAEAEHHLVEGQRLYRQFGDDAGLAQSQYHLARIAIEQGQYDAAEKLLASSEAIYRALDEQLSLAAVFYRQARLYYEYGPDHARAKLLAESALAIQEQWADSAGLVQTWRLLAQIAGEQGEYGMVCQRAEEALRLAQEIQDPAEIASCLYILSFGHNAQQNFAQALIYAEKSQLMFRQIGNKRNEAMAKRQTSLILIETEEYARALPLARECADTFAALGDHFGQALALRSVGDIYVRTGQIAAGKAAWLQTEAIAQRLAHSMLLASIEKRLGAI